MRNSIYLLLAFCIALACGCSSSDSPTAPAQLPDGPVVEISTDKAFVAPGETVAVEIRAGIRKDGVVTYIENVEIYADLDDAEESSIEGLTDADGKLAQTITYRDDLDDSNGILMEVSAEFSDGGEAERNHWIYRPNELKAYEQYTQSQAGVLFRINGGGTIGYREYLLNLDEEVGVYDANHATSQSGSIGSMTSAASATTTGTLGVSSAPDNLQFTFDIAVNGELTLADPVTSGSYFAESFADAELDVEFVVWGEKDATLTINGDIDMANYEIVIEGRPFDEDNYNDIEEVICYRDESTTGPACPQISRTLKLKPGEYEICIEMEDSRKFLDEGPTEGRATYDGSADLTVTITQ